MVTSILLSRETKVPVVIFVLLVANLTLLASTRYTKYIFSFGGILPSTSSDPISPVTINPSSPENNEELTFMPVFLTPVEVKYW